MLLWPSRPRAPGADTLNYCVMFFMKSLAHKKIPRLHARHAVTTFSISQEVWRLLSHSIPDPNLFLWPWASHFFRPELSHPPSVAGIMFHSSLVPQHLLDGAWHITSIENWGSWSHYMIWKGPFSHSFLWIPYIPSLLSLLSILVFPTFSTWQHDLISSCLFVRVFLILGTLRPPTWYPCFYLFVKYV